MTEYKVITLAESAQEAQRQLQTHASEGWSVVAVVPKASWQAWVMLARNDGQTPENAAVEALPRLPRRGK